MGNVERRALFITSIDKAGGAERVLATAASDLASQAGWDVEIAVLAGPTPPFLINSCGAARVTYGYWGGHMGTEWLLIPRLVGRRYDLVYASHTRLNAFLSLARRLGILRCDRLIARESTVFADRYSGPQLAVTKILYSFYGQQDLIVAQTSYMKQRLSAMLPPGVHQKVLMVPNPVDVQAIKKAAHIPLDPILSTRLSARLHVAWCGRLVDIKQPILAIDTIAELRKVHSLDISLVMIGDGPEMDKVRDHTRARNIEDGVILLGHVDNPYPVMAACRYGLLTSKREGFPNVLLEMMALNLDFIVTTPCAGDLDTLCGVEIVNATPEQLATAIATAHLNGTDRSDRYQRVLARRSAKALVSALLGK